MRQGFNGKESDGEVANDNYDFGARIYEAIIGRFLTIDPESDEYNIISNYIISNNSVIVATDINGEYPDLTINENEKLSIENKEKSSGENKQLQEEFYNTPMNYHYSYGDDSKKPPKRRQKLNTQSSKCDDFFNNDIIETPKEPNKQKPVTKTKLKVVDHILVDKQRSHSNRTCHKSFTAKGYFQVRFETHIMPDQLIIKNENVVRIVNTGLISTDLECGGVPFEIDLPSGKYSITVIAGPKNSIGCEGSTTNKTAWVIEVREKYQKYKIASHRNCSYGLLYVHGSINKKKGIIAKKDDFITLKKYNTTDGKEKYKDHKFKKGHSVK